MRNWEWGDPKWRFTFGERLRKARKVRGLSQEVLARDLGISRGTLSRYERMEKIPSRNLVKQWAFRTGVAYEWLLDGDFEVHGEGGEVSRVYRFPKYEIWD